MDVFYQTNKWIENQQHESSANKMNRVRIPNFKNYVLVTLSSGKKQIRLYDYNKDSQKVQYINLGEFPYTNFELAYKKGQDILFKKARNEFIPSKEITFKELFDEFLIYAENDLKFKQNTLKGYRVRSQKWCKKVYDLQIKNITIDKIEKEIFDTSENYKETTKRLYYILFNIFRYAVKKNYIENNILKNYDIKAKYKISSKKETKHHEKIINKDDLKAFLKNVVSDKKLRRRELVCILVGLETGLRSMNLMNLAWKHINLETGLVTIPREEMKGERRTEAFRQNFILPLSENLTRILEVYKSKYLGEKLFKGVSDRRINIILKKHANITKHGFRGTLKTHFMKNIMVHKIDRIFIEMYLGHEVAIGEVEASYLELNYLDKDIQAALRQIANWWSNYLYSMVDYTNILGEKHVN
ncbi:tyrosine-type recombinase/integrase [Campylobacter geochelonis]|uniref:tyrosine-type recombinase/integrase n=1 Tax=Campylobacter geochelonis TaxID=1780362 RepID=UPI0007707578|nr:tyrosine-type recombinase/integrase [Campylobacter geochelonis]CZE50832.1 site-specific recombinase phage integrase family protein [Campylobacter geochelonis]